RKHFIAKSVIPSFTNPNNISIITGRPPEVHGISGNYYYDPKLKMDVMMNDPSLLRAPSIIQKFQETGAKVATVTAKDKLRLLLGNGLDFSKSTAICFSAEKADITTLEENGMDKADQFVGMKTPEIYSAELSEFVLKAGVVLLKKEKPDLMYLSTTDYVQHAYGPKEKEALDFYEMCDSYFSQLDKLGATLVITADHGMNAKSNQNGEPNIFFLESFLKEISPSGKFHVVLPITDPYVGHHGALGSFGGIYLKDLRLKSQIKEKLSREKGIVGVLDRATAADSFELPSDRIADLVVLADRQTVIGKSPKDHDLSMLHGPLRSHGGLFEQQVPLLLNFRLPEGIDTDNLRNYDAFFLAANRARNS
ncbi:phosphonoacetate hydrolase, partial [Xanthovirga aplysinae]|uniref:phosphonoacetate hydrolase n=1 Tax=Xanthovirga aplysinae TaxID=2529853 RepID=UPI0012BB851F